MKAIGYSRISTSDQSEYSLDNQERMIREYCDRNKLPLATIFKDDGQSSYTFDRPDFKALEAFIKKNRDVSHLIVLDHDRFSRNLAEALMKIHELQKKFGIKVLATSDNFDADFSDPSNFMIRAFKLMMAESELHNIRKRTKAGIVQASMAGRWCRVAPYGYVNKRDKDDKPIIEQHPERAEIVRMIFREYLSGMDIRRVMIRAREMGYKQTSHSAIQRILSNPVYAGLIPIPAHKGRKRPFAQGLHVPIILEQDFWLVQERFTTRKKGTHLQSNVFLRGALRNYNGHLMTSDKSRSKTGRYYWYYVCPDTRKYHQAERLHEQFQALLETLSIAPEHLDALKSRLSQEIRHKLGGQQENRKQYLAELKRHQLQVKAAERRYLTSGNLSEDTFNEVMAEMKAEEVRLQKALMEAATDGAAYFDRITTFLDRLGNLWENFKSLTPDKQIQFIALGFDQPFYYYNGCYRTQGVHPALAPNIHIANEKGLLKIEKPVKLLQNSPSVPQTGPLSNSNWLEKTLELMELIA